MTDSSDTPAVPDVPGREVPGTELPKAHVPGADLPVAAPAAGAPADEERAAGRSRRRRAAVRWSAAAVVCALAGTGSAIAVTAPERTDLPGLATKSDGRYTFPALVLPPLPSGKAAPKDNKNRHAADLRQLLLPVPKEVDGQLVPAPSVTGGGPTGASASATPSESPATTSPSASPTARPAGLVDCNSLADEQQDPAAVRALLLQYACRAAAVREWTTFDGTRTQIRLLSFGSSGEAWSAFAGLRDGKGPKTGATIGSATPQDWDEVYGVTVKTQVSGPGDAPTARLAYVAAGDIVGVVTMTNPDGVPAAAFRQVVTLQSDLLA
ncbi:hypothetical protein ABT093_03380 [Kitasatospora sp. NPDC002551]|uniref:hypothetical protein n=1 Tax=unclassified Kitasatospora TaxID=2633591 RepID=UPI0033318BCC